MVGSSGDGPIPRKEIMSLSSFREPTISANIYIDMKNTEITDYRKVNTAAEIMRKLNESRMHLRLSNLFSCIVAFRDVLEIFLNSAEYIRADRAKVVEALNEFQHVIPKSHQFRDLYGVVSFRDNDFATTYEFIGQLIIIKEDEINNVLINRDVGRSLNLDKLNEEERQRILKIVSLTERGEQMVLTQMVAQNDELASLVLSYYNESGISSRLAGDINRAVQEYKKALFIAPEDENLFYNLARAYIEMGNKKQAEDCVSMALKLNPHFHEGLKLQAYISQWVT
jgi:tetratricopeptide (TPR) repeat protein